MIPYSDDELSQIKHNIRANLTEQYQRHVSTVEVHMNISPKQELSGGTDEIQRPELPKTKDSGDR